MTVILSLAIGRSSGRRGPGEQLRDILDDRSTCESLSSCGTVSQRLPAFGERQGNSRTFSTMKSTELAISSSKVPCGKLDSNILFKTNPGIHGNLSKKQLEKTTAKDTLGSAYNPWNIALSTK